MYHLSDGYYTVNINYILKSILLRNVKINKYEQEGYFWVMFK